METVIHGARYQIIAVTGTEAPLLRIKRRGASQPLALFAGANAIRLRNALANVTGETPAGAAQALDTEIDLILSGSHPLLTKGL
jgi:hypothetical protein